MGAVATAAALALTGGAYAAQPALSDDGRDSSPRHGKAKNIILLIGDGMGQTHVDAGRIRYYGADGQLNMEKLPVLGSVRTWAVQRDSDQPELVTDSASAATAWSSGVKTYNAAIGLDSFGEIVPTIMEQAKTAGFRTGNVSTAEITDATPAAMFSHAALRGCQGLTYTPPPARRSTVSRTCPSRSRSRGTTSPTSSYVVATRASRRTTSR